MDDLAGKRRQRGEVQLTDIEPFLRLSQKQLLEQLNSPEAVNRTCAAITLAGINDPIVADELCLRLSVEKKLYCKIAVCDALVNIAALSIKPLPVKPLLLLLGKIGNNQEKEVPKTGFSKKSYPLPRDIAARTLCRIGPSIISDLFDFVETTKTPLIVEQAIDVIGHINYTNGLIISSELLLRIASEHDEFSMVNFKITRCFSGFKDAQAKQFLLKQLKSPHIGFKYEATRSLVLSGFGLPKTGYKLPQEVLNFAARL